MPYTVEVVTNEDDAGQGLLNTLEVNGWTLVQVIQAYGDHPPQFIFHKPLDEREEALRQAGKPRH